MVNFTEDFRERMRKKLARYKEMDPRRTISNLKVVV